ncbi:bifunctional hydroxymethylpyrimidine kinase/phosphomethylpyrimidine kinase [Chitinophagaceae bacterium MMS25-I14]
MNTQKTYVLSIAGFDPSAGAGLLSDIKTLENCGVYGLGVMTALTFQNDIHFESADWIRPDKITRQIALQLERFDVKCVKIGLVESFEVLLYLLHYLHQNIPGVKIFFDPVLKASAGFCFHSNGAAYVETLLPQLYCITPNIPEAEQLFGENDLDEKLKSYSTKCNIYLKGGHSKEMQMATDILYSNGTQHYYTNVWLEHGEKHGSGCVLSSALAAATALGHDIVSAGAMANRYTHTFLASNETLLGHHLKTTL